MPDYKWGIFLAPARAGSNGALRGLVRQDPVWQEVPGEFRNHAAPHHRDPGRHRAGERRAAAAAVRTAPSMYDCRNLFQVNVEEGRHLWAMVYLLHAHFGGTAAKRPRNCSSAAPVTSTSRAS